MNFPDAIAALRLLQWTAVTTVAQLKKDDADTGHIRQGREIYDAANGHVESVIYGLFTVLDEEHEPKRLASLENQIELARQGLAELDQLAKSLHPKTRGSSTDTILQLANKLSDAVAVLYEDWRKDKEREAIKKLLEEVRWPSFDHIEASG